MKTLGFFPEKEFINRIKSNDRTVLGELFVRYEKMVMSYITQHGGNAADAEDMLQEAIIVLWQNVCSGNFKLTSKLSTYLLAVAKNKWMAEKRKRSKIQNGGLSDTTPDDSPTSLEMVVNKENTGFLQQAMDTLKPVCKKLLLLFYFEERSLQDISKILGFANADVAKSKKYQCKRALENILRRELAQSEGSIE
ncbi:MAG: RNA polymerase sigma factor [bacterium]